jgi:crotonobetainyl-CoA:carnitine CoA-transferase CaiB-like acyl-CoA transferase
MGLPVAGHGSTQQVENWFTRHPGPSLPAREPRRQPLVIDLSSLWAGPLCSHLLERSGARVIRVESTHRPDPTQFAAPAFFESLNQNKQTVTVDFRSRRGARALHDLLSKADIVIEASRPRALTQLGIDAEALVRTRAGRIWLSITAYGRHPPNADWVGFGDDVAIAAGAARTTANGPAFFGDAVADPLTGLHAALAVIYHWQSGLGGLLDVSLYAVTAWCLTHGRRPGGREADQAFDNPTGTQ